MTLGRNTEVGRELTEYIERIEACMGARQTVSDDISAIFAEAKARGFIPKGMRAAIKVRAMKPHDRQESEHILATYLHALGDEAETPLFRAVNNMAVDITSRDDVAAALRQLVPENGSIIVEAGGKGVKLTRNKDGDIESRDLSQPAFPSPGGERPASARERGAVGKPANPATTPDVDGEGAEELGRQAFRDNEPVIRNPFPFGDDRRPRWDGGWRKESGSDGMGPAAGAPGRP